MGPDDLALWAIKDAHRRYVRRAELVEIDEEIETAIEQELSEGARSGRSAAGISVADALREACWDFLNHRTT